MAGPIRISILANAKQATAQLTAVENSVGRVGARFTKLRAPAAAVAAGFVAVGGGLLNLAKGAAEDEKAQAILAQTLRNSAKATDTQVASVEDYISKVGAATGVTDDEMRPALANLVRATGDVTKAQDLMGLAMDISAGTGKDLGAVSLALAKAQKGSVGGLAKLGIATKDVSGKTKTFTQLQGDLVKQFKGQAAKAADTTAGKYARVKLQLAETGEALGAKLLPAMLKVGDFLLNKMVPGLEKTLAFAERNKTTLAILAGVVGGLAATILVINGVMAIWGGLMKVVTAATKAWAIAQAALNVIMALNPVLLVVLAIVALVAIIVLAAKRSDAFRSVLTKAFDAIKTGVLAVLRFFRDLPGNIAKAVGSTAKLLFNKGKDLIFGLAKGYLSLWASVGRFFLGIGAAVVRWIGNTARTLYTKGAQFLVGMMQGVASRVTGIVRFWASLPFNIATWLGNTARTLFFKGANFVIGLHQGIVSRIAALARFVASIPGSILRWVGDVGRLLWNAGTRIIQGLIDGITSKVQALKDQLSSITNLIPNIKGPESRDRKLLTPAGRAIIDGLIRGMDDELGTLQRFLRGTSSMIESGLSPSPSVALAGAFTGSTSGTALPPIQITVQTLAGGPEVGRQVADALDDYFRTNGPRPWSRPS